MIFRGRSMIGVLPIGRVIVFVAVVYAVIVALAVAIAWKFFGHSQTVRGSMTIAISGATALHLVLMGCLYMGWRRLWRWFPHLNRLLFPDIGGVWDMQIHWQGAENQHGVIDAKATVKQDFLRVSMEVRSARSESQTLIAQPRRDPG